MSVRMLGVLAGVLVGGFALPPSSAQSASVERGRYLVNTVAACGNCHNPRDADNRFVEDKALAGGTRVHIPKATVFSSNITPDPETGIGRWTDEQIVRAMREGIRPDGSLIGPPMPILLYRRMSDDDVQSIVAYLRTVPPVKNEVQRSTYEFAVSGYGPPITTPVVAAPAGDPVKYGEYLVAVGLCMACHSGTAQPPTEDDFKNRTGSGGRQFGPTKAANLTPHEDGLKDWSDIEVARAVREGISRDGRQLRPPMAFSMYKNISDADMQAIISYLRSLKPLPTGG